MIISPAIWFLQRPMFSRRKHGSELNLNNYLQIITTCRPFAEVKKYAAVRLGSVEVLEAVHAALQGFMLLYFFMSEWSDYYELVKKIVRFGAFLATKMLNVAVSSQSVVKQW